MNQQHIEVTFNPVFEESIREVSYLVMPSGLILD